MVRRLTTATAGTLPHSAAPPPAQLSGGVVSALLSCVMPFFVTMAIM